jgi:hypothetical protein
VRSLLPAATPLAVAVGRRAIERESLEQLRAARVRVLRGRRSADAHFFVDPPPGADSGAEGDSGGSDVKSEEEDGEE